MVHLVLTERNLRTLLSKLERRRAGEDTLCTILKQDTTHPVYPLTEPVMVTAVFDHEYYFERSPGAVSEKDLPNV